MKKIITLALFAVSATSLSGMSVTTAQAAKHQHTVPKALQGKWNYQWKMDDVPGDYIYFNQKSLRAGKRTYKISYITGSTKSRYTVHLKRKFAGSKTLTFKYKLREVDHYANVKSLSMSTKRYVDSSDALYIKGYLENYKPSNFIKLSGTPDIFDSSVSGYTIPNAEVSISGDEEASTVADASGYFKISVEGNFDEYEFSGDDQLVIWSKGPKSNDTFKKTFELTANSDYSDYEDNDDGDDYSYETYNYNNDWN
ncbi:hypothetical protein [Levilactobacillus parabrevis]|uniref:hypothetical protein n=1 Tax=Levilactobacillus parabrevis TaxID=357278 RepID=UPI0021A7A69F|nr:hypothetical protein [Levilactobacillus parabrevis]MCT4487165.1 hypothetical protein [Levilactobacillus parabrevis]MCT4490527.1 hypothetical protein [Levilactobacillus parabrevis]